MSDRHSAVRGAAIEAGAIDLGIELRRLALVDARDRGEPALRDQPLHHQAERVDGECRRRVVERAVLRVHRIVHHRRQRRLAARRALDEIVANDDDGQAGRAHVLLRAGVDQRVPRDVDRPAEHVGRGVADERRVADLRQRPVLGAFDRVVRRDVDVGGAGVSCSSAWRGMRT